MVLGGAVRVSQGSPEKQNQSRVCVRVRACVRACPEAYFKELAHAVGEAGKSKIWRAGRQAGNPEKS